MKFRRLPLEVEAKQFTDAYSLEEIIAWVTDHGGSGYLDSKPDLGGQALVILTPEGGQMEVSRNDWVIKGVTGGFYPCSADIFALSYEPC